MVQIHAAGVNQLDSKIRNGEFKVLAQRLPNGDLIIYPDSGHGAVFQFHADFVPRALEFLER